MTTKDIESKTSTLIGKFKKATGWKETGKSTTSPAPSLVTNLVSGQNSESDAEGGEVENEAEEKAEEAGSEADNGEEDEEQTKVGEAEEDEEEGEEAQTQPQFASYCTPPQPREKPEAVGEFDLGDSECLAGGFPLKLKLLLLTAFDSQLHSLTFNMLRRNRGEKRCGGIGKGTSKAGKQDLQGVQDTVVD